MKNSRVIYLGTFTLLALSFAPAPLCELYCMPGDCKESAETKKIQKKSEATFSDCLAKLQTIVKWKEREAAQADKKDAPRLDDNEIKEARTAFLTTVERGQETLPNLAAKKDKTADMQLGQLTAVYAILQEEQFNDIRK